MAVKAILQDLDRDDINAADFHKRWDKKMFPFHLHVGKARRFLPISRIMTGSLHLLLKEYKIDVDRKSLQKYVTFTRSSFINLARAFKDTRPALHSLTEQGYDLRVLSNADMDLYKQLARMDLMKFFGKSVTSYQARSYKPVKTIFIKALKAARCGAHEAAMVGDSYENDVVGASKVGMTTILVDRNASWNARKIGSRIRPDHVVSNLLGIGERLG
jgi:2-haloalkanoic acid dehalogenase type II